MALEVDRRSKKWRHGLFWGLRRSVALGLISHKQCVISKRRSTKVINVSLKKRRGHGYSIPADVRLSNRGAHWVIFDNNRGRCEVCSKKSLQSKAISKCSTRRVSLWCNATKNCFMGFHLVSV